MYDRVRMGLFSIICIIRSDTESRNQVILHPVEEDLTSDISGGGEGIYESTLGVAQL